MGKLAVLAFGSCASASASPGTADKFTEFEASFGKSYSPEEREMRFKIFVENLKTIETSQQNERGTAVYSHLTPFTDLTPEEFESRMGLIPMDLDAGTGELLPTDNVPAAYDWRDHGALNTVRDQKQCGSCWAFSLVANMEGVGFVETGKLVRLSEQELVDCSEVDHGCGGGMPPTTLQNMLDKKRGMMYREDYRYKSKAGQCKYDQSLSVFTFKNWVKIAEDDDQIMAAVVKYGPLSIAINAHYLQQYKGGIADPANCKGGGSKNHAIAMVGYGSEGGLKYWQVRNSWGLTFGENGYFRQIRGKNSCGINEQVDTVYNVAIDDSRPEPPQPTPGPNTCIAKGVAVMADCKTYCKDHRGMAGWKTPGPTCDCQDGDGCVPWDDFSLHVVV